jgi:hypothetical protein
MCQDFWQSDTMSKLSLAVFWNLREEETVLVNQEPKKMFAPVIYFFFGKKKKVSSGHILIPNSPYVIGLFLCRDDEVNFPCKSRYFQTSGRFVCLGKPAPVK